MSTLRPADIWRLLLAILDAVGGCRQRRKRATIPDAMGLAMKRALLAGVLQDDLEPAAFERWLLEQCQASGVADGPVHAMALEVLAAWRLAATSQPFQSWLARGAPSDDAL